MYCGVNSVGEGNESVWRFRAIETFTHTSLYSPPLSFFALFPSSLFPSSLPTPLLLPFFPPLILSLFLPLALSISPSTVESYLIPSPSLPFLFPPPPPHSIICIHIIIVGLPRHRCVWQWRSEEVRSPRRYQSYSLLSLSGYQTSFWEEIEG